MYRQPIRPRLRGFATFALLAATALAQAASVPDFSLASDHGPVRLADLRGKTVYLDFWASWCSPCRSSFPWMNAMQARYADKGLVIVAVNLDKDKALAQTFLAQMPAKFTVAYDPEGAVAKQFQVKGMPSSFVIDRDGEVQATHVGFRDKDKAELESQIQRLVTR